MGPTLADKLGVPFLGIIYDRTPGGIAVIMAVFSPLLLMYVIKPAVDGFVPRWGDAWMTFRLDLIWAVSAGLLAYGCVRYLPADFRLNKWVALTFAVLLPAGGLVFAVVKVVSERGKGVAAAQHINPGAVYHNLFLCTMLPLTIGLMAAALTVHAWQSRNVAPFGMVLLALLLIGGLWAGWGLAYDGAHQVNADGINKHDLAHSAHWMPWRDDWHGYRGLWQSILRALHLPNHWSPDML